VKLGTIGIDLVKQFFQVHGVDEAGRALLNKQLRRKQMAEFFVNLPSCLIGMEACSSDPASFPHTASHAANRLRSLVTGATNPMAVCIRTRL